MASVTRLALLTAACQGLSEAGTAADAQQTSRGPAVE